jgi:hypothetical protein
MPSPGQGPTGNAVIATIPGNVTVVQPTGSNLHTVVDSGSVAVTGSVTATQATGTNLHTVVDSGAVTVSQSAAANLKVSLADTGANATAINVNASGYDQPIIQDAWALPHNSSVANINAGATWAGSAWDSSLGVNGIQVNIVASQNCTVYVDQSMSGTNTDITDAFNYIASKGGNSWTIQATASFVKVRVKNTGSATATSVEIQTVLCPIVEAVPRALGAYGNLKVSVRDILSPGFEKRNIISPMRALKVAESC